MSYDGFLKYVLPEMARMRSAGFTYREITESPDIARAFYQNTPGGWHQHWPPTVSAVSYALRDHMARRRAEIARRWDETAREVGLQREIARKVARQIWYEHRAARGIGRPLDMGGPRDVWLTDDPV